MRMLSPHELHAGQTTTCNGRTMTIGEVRVFDDGVQVIDASGRYGFTVAWDEVVPVIADKECAA